MSTAIAVFVKTPALSPVKTRLAAGIGDEAAQEFYALSLNAVKETVQSLQNCHCEEPGRSFGEGRRRGNPENWIASPAARNDEKNASGETIVIPDNIRTHDLQCHSPTCSGNPWIACLKQAMTKGEGRPILDWNGYITPYWAVAEQDGLADPLWQDFQALWTGEDCLGKRQHHIYETLLGKHERVLLIGADTPQLSKDILEQAITALDTHDFVIGPARDGGYYLFGGRISTKENIWTSVPWSTAITRERLEAALPSKPAHLQMLTDVDTKEDLAQMIKELPEKQHALLEWARSARAFCV